MADMRVPNPEDHPRDFIDVPVLVDYAYEVDGFWEPVWGSQRYVKRRLGPHYWEWVLEGEAREHDT
jgi:hypothetical protein